MQDLKAATIETGETTIFARWYGSGPPLLLLQSTARDGGRRYRRSKQTFEEGRSSIRPSIRRAIISVVAGNVDATGQTAGRTGVARLGTRNYVFQIFVSRVAQQRQHGRTRGTLNGPLLAPFLQKLENDETLLLQRQRDLEEQAHRSALRVKTPRALKPHAAPPPVALDRTKLPQYEEYT